MKKKIDSREIVNNLSILVEHDLMTKQPTLFDMHDTMLRLQEWYGGDIGKVRLEKPNNTVLTLAFPRTHIELVLTVDCWFNVKKIDMLWWHGAKLKCNLVYWLEDNGDWMFGDFKGEPTTIKHKAGVAA